MSTPPVQINLRELERGDLPTLNQWRNDEELIDLLGNNFLYISTAIDERWYENYLKERDRAVRLSILAGDPERYVGNVNLTSIHRINQSAELSILIGEKEYWSKGIGLTAVQRILEHGFNDLNLHRVYLTVLSGNERAIRTYRRAGFVEEGRQRQAIYKKGSHRDLVMMSILRSEFAPSKQ